MLRKDDIAGELTQLAFDYFYWFSRFEFCLKENGFLRNKEPGAIQVSAFRIGLESLERA